MSKVKTDRTYYGIQALRAVAALMVVLVHSIYLWHNRILHEAVPQYWMNGAAGVDIFFVISGFVMTITLPGLDRYENPARVFLWRRITRIIPLYWLATSLKVALVLAIPAAVMHRGVSLTNVIGSYFFIPTVNADGVVAPVIVQGWTLNYEMLFYVVFTGCLLLRTATLRLLVLMLSTMAVISILHPIWHWPIQTLLSPMLVEFLFGVVIAKLTVRRRLPGVRSGLVFVIAGFVAILTLYPHLPESSPVVNTWRFLIWGIPAGAIVLGMVALEPVLGERFPRWVVVAGNASYAVYLVQTFVLPVVGISVGRLHVSPVAALLLVTVFGLSLSFIAGDLVHRFIELPVLAKLKRLDIPGVSTVPQVEARG